MLVAAQLTDLSALRNCTAPADQVASSAVRKVSSPGRRSHRARTSRAAQVNARRRRLMRADNSTSGAAGITQRRRMRYTDRSALARQGPGRIITSYYYAGKAQCERRDSHGIPPSGQDWRAGVEPVFWHNVVWGRRRRRDVVGYVSPLP